jgi:hypothetical protein
MSFPFRRGLAVVPVLFAALLASCTHDSPTEPLAVKTFTGTYAMITVDGLDLPTTIVTGFGGRNMTLQQGRLVFDGSSLALNITGPIDGGANSITLGTGATYTVAGADSLRGALGVSGRVWADSADLQTSSFTLAGAHRFRFVRAASSSRVF